MCYVVFMYVLQSREGLSHDGCSLSFSYVFVFLGGNVVEELTSCTVLAHDETDAISLPSLIDLDDVGMIELSEDVDLHNESLIVTDLHLLDCLHSHLYPWSYKTYRCVCSWLGRLLHNHRYQASFQRSIRL